MEWIPIVFVIFKACVFFTGMFFAIKWHYDRGRKEENEKGGPQSSTELRLFVTIMIVSALSVLGIVYAGSWGDPADGGRGGAIGCALTFCMALMSFMSKPTAEIVFNARPGDPATQIEGHDQLARLEFRAERLRAAFVARLDSVEREKVYLSVASIISTLAWKFGDIAAAWLNFRH